MTQRTAYRFNWKTCFLRVATSIGSKQSLIATKINCWVYIYIHVLHKGTKSQNSVLFHKLCCRVCETQLSYFDAVYTCPLQVFLLTRMEPAVTFCVFTNFYRVWNRCIWKLSSKFRQHFLQQMYSDMYHRKPSAWPIDYPTSSATTS